MARALMLRLLILAVVLQSGCQGTREVVTVFHAGSLSPLLHQAAERFQQHHPGVRIRGESSGSLDALRKITELDRGCDIVAVADYRLLDRLLEPGTLTRAYVFLGNELVLAGGRSGPWSAAQGKQPWEENWFEWLPGRYSYGASDPDRDPAGYYAHLAWKLAEMHYDRPGLYRDFLAGLSPRWVRPRSSELIALLESGALDFAFIYKSTALQNNLEFISLPAQISLAEENYASSYARVFLLVSGATPDDREEIMGAPIRYGTGLLQGASDPARRFFDFLLGPEVESLYRELGYVNVPIQEIRLKELPP